MRLLDFLNDYGEAVEDSKERRKAHEAEIAKARRKTKRPKRRR